MVSFFLLSVEMGISLCCEKTHTNKEAWKARPKKKMPASSPTFKPIAKVVGTANVIGVPFLEPQVSCLAFTFSMNY